MTKTPAAALALARRASAQAELAAEAGDLRTAQALRGAAASWERLARPGVPWSYEPARRHLIGLKREVAVANGPFKAPQPPKAPSPAAARPEPTTADLSRRVVESVQHLQEPTTIEF
jgi:hypothetical protein